MICTAQPRAVRHWADLGRDPESMPTGNRLDRTPSELKSGYGAEIMGLV